MGEIGRRPIQIVEVDIDFCSRTYGSSPCTAVLGTTGVRKCYNTYATCQDVANFDKTALTLRFAENVSGLPKGQTIFPSLAGRVDMDPGSINLGGVDQNRSPLGTRETVTVQLQDFTYSDVLTDPYRAGRIDGTAQTDEGGYDPASRGTFFGKLRRRFPYYLGRALRVKDGYVGEALGAMRTRNYVITDWKGPDASGRVTIEAADVLDLADNDKALCPAPNSGALQAPMGAGDLSLALDPAGVGDAEYPASGRAVIGSEVVDFVRSGDSITLTGRGLDGTSAQSHSAGDTFQACFRVEGVPVAEVIRDMLVDYAGVDSSFITFSDWSDEADLWLAGFNLTRTLTKPTGVTKLIGEILQLGAVIWWDGVAQKIRFKANRPVAFDEVVPSITDGNAVIRDTVGNEDLNDQRLTRVVMAHGQLDTTGSVDDADNYRRFAIATNPGAASDIEHGQDRTKWLYMPWLGDGDDSVARPVVRRLLGRYVNTPRRVSFRADTKDRANLEQAAVISMTTRVLQDETGRAAPTQMQITAAKEEGMDRLAVTAETFTFDGRYGFITENSRPDYDASDATEIAKGTYIVGPSELFSDSTGPYLMF